MNPAMWASKSGIQAQDAKLQAIAHNLANVNTVGFKRDRAMFADLSYQVEQQPGAQIADNAQAPSGVQLGTGTRLIGTQKVFTNGSLQNTGQQFDLAIVGQGFLRVEMAGGETAYTRAGQLQVSPEGRLSNAQGFPILPEITVPASATALSIGENGQVTATVSGSSAPVELGQITLAGFVNPAGLLALGDNLYRETTASGVANEAAPGTNGLGTIKQGALEGSNVQVVEEMVEMITAQRTYEMNTKVLSAADSMLQSLAQAAR